MTLKQNISSQLTFETKEVLAFAMQPGALKVTGIFITLASIGSFLGIPVIISGLFFKDFFDDSLRSNKQAKPNNITPAFIKKIFFKSIKALLFPLTITLLYFFGSIAILFVNPDLVISILYLRAIMRISVFANNDLIRVLFYQISFYLLSGSFFKFLFPDVKPFNVLI